MPRPSPRRYEVKRRYTTKNGAGLWVVIECSTGQIQHNPQPFYMHYIDASTTAQRLNAND